MLDLLIGSLSEIKSYVVVLSFFIKMMKKRTFQACSLKHSIKKGMFYVQGKLNFFKLGRAGVTDPVTAIYSIGLKLYKNKFCIKQTLSHT